MIAISIENMDITMDINIVNINMYKGSHVRYPLHFNLKFLGLSHPSSPGLWESTLKTLHHHGHQQGYHQTLIFSINPSIIEGIMSIDMGKVDNILSKKNDILSFNIDIKRDQGSNLS